MKAKLALTAALALALGIGCSSDSDDVHLHDGTGAQTGDTGGASGETGSTTGDAGASSQVGGASSGGDQGTGGSDGGRANGGSGNASSGGTGGVADTGGASSGGTGGAATGGTASGGEAIGGASTGGAGAASSGGTGGLACDAPCILLCEGGLCDCYCDSAGGAPTGGAAGAPPGGASSGGGATGGAGGATDTCGGVVCSSGEECCGPPECGYCIPVGTDPACAGSCTRRACGDEGLECLDPVLGYPGEICVTRQRTAGPTVILGYECARNPCGTDPLDCTCAAEVCVDGSVPGPQCMDPNPDALTLVCDDFQGICNSPGTLIATPSGDRPIASLRTGDLVYSVHEQAVVAVPVLRATRTPVHHHHVVRLETEGGVVLEISPGHPTVDGRSLGELAPGDQLDGDRVLSTELIPYQHEYTYDILPASDTGTYFADGLRIASTLAPRP